MPIEPIKTCKTNKPDNRDEVIVTVVMEKVETQSKEPEPKRKRNCYAPLQIYPQDLKKLEEKFQKSRTNLFEK